MVKLVKLLEKLEYTVLQKGKADICDVWINNLVMDSRKVEKDDVFVCISGTVRDAHDFIADVINKGATAIIVEKDVRVSEEITVIKVDSTRYALGFMSAAFFDYPADKLKTIGITGTKGKTTTAYMVMSILEKVGIKTGLIGTIETIIGNDHITAQHTTPESLEIQRSFARMVECGCKAVVMEVSSQGLMLHRVAGITFDYGIFTNLSKDHIGKNEHKDFDDYKQCKSRLFKQCKNAIINIDDKNAKDIIKDGTFESLETFSIGNDSADYNAENIQLFREKGVLGLSYDIEIKGEDRTHFEIEMPGKFNVYNTLTALAICRHYTKDMDLIAKALRQVRVRGRVELVPVSDKFTIMLDYAHNAVSMESLVNSIKEYEPKRLVTVFGCGGNRDRNRRFDMGEISSRMADFTIVTSDNPRNERPEDIIADIITGIQKAEGRYVTIPDRREAIKYAIEYAQEGDVILVVGKGHEDYQIIGDVKYHMDDKELILDAKRELNM